MGGRGKPFATPAAPFQTAKGPSNKWVSRPATQAPFRSRNLKNNLLSGPFRTFAVSIDCTLTAETGSQNPGTSPCGYAHVREQCRGRGRIGKHCLQTLSGEMGKTSAGRAPGWDGRGVRGRGGIASCWGQGTANAIWRLDLQGGGRGSRVAWPQCGCAGGL